MSDFFAGKFYPLNPNSRVWKGGRFVDGVTASGAAPNAQGVLGVSDVTGLEAALSSKSDVGHQHSISDVHPIPLVPMSDIDGGTFF